MSYWGSRGTPFVALVDFDRNLLAATLPSAQLTGTVDLCGVQFSFRFNDAASVKTQELRGNGSRREASRWQKADGSLKLVLPPDRAAFVESIHRVQAELAGGYSYLVNICSQSIVESSHSPCELYNRASSPFAFWLEGEFLSFTPEAFVVVEGDTISTHPMKGTAADREALLADHKEMAEHATVVDLLRNDLGQVARHIKLRHYRYVSEIARNDGSVLFQTSSHITGTMPQNWRSTIGEWLPRLLPAGSISGAPKYSTLDIIRRYERSPRGFFTGIAVLFDGQNLYSAVLIRYIDISKPQWLYRSGAGVTIYSDAEQEYEEILNKVYFPG